MSCTASSGRKLAAGRVHHHVGVAGQHRRRVLGGHHPHWRDSTQLPGVATRFGIAVHDKIDQLQLRMVDHPTQGDHTHGARTPNPHLVHSKSPNIRKNFVTFWTDGRELTVATSMGTSTAKSPPTGRVMDVLATLADSPSGRTSAELAKICAISTSTCALVLAELERRAWVARREDRRYVLGSGLFGLVHGLRMHFPLLDRGRDALCFLHDTLGAGCSMSKIGGRYLTTVDAVGHGTDGEHAVGQRFPIDPPFGLVAMAWRDDDFVQAWLHRVMPRLTRTEIAQHQRVLADIRARGYGAWRFDDTHQSLHNRLADVLASLEPTAQVTRQLTTLMTMVTLQSVTDVLETELASMEFVVLPIFGQDGQPEYQIEIHLARPAGLTLAELEVALRHAQGLLTDWAT